MIAVSYIMKIKIKKIFFEVIPNSKILNIIFSTKLSTSKIFPNLQGANRQRGGDWTESNTVLVFNSQSTYADRYELSFAHIIY